MDNLVIGFALGTYGVGILEGALVIGAVSVAMSLAGLLCFGLCADPDLVDHLVVMAEGIEAEAEDLLAAAASA